MPQQSRGRHHDIGARQQVFHHLIGGLDTGAGGQ